MALCHVIVVEKDYLRLSVHTSTATLFSPPSMTTVSI